jgi:hypothetical protein
MQRDPWPPLPPGGHRAPDTPPFGGFAEQALLYGLLGTGIAGLLAWSAGQLAGLVFGHTWLDLGINDVASVLWQLPHHWNDPALAWPAHAHGALPGPVGMYASSATLVGGAAGGTAAVARHLPGRAAGHRPGREHTDKGSAWARGRELRLLTVTGPEPGRVILGRTPGLPGLSRLLAAQDCHSVLVFGPVVIFGQAPRWLPGQRRCIGDGVLDAT